MAVFVYDDKFDDSFDSNIFEWVTEKTNRVNKLCTDDSNNFSNLLFLA